MTEREKALKEALELLLRALGPTFGRVHLAALYAQSVIDSCPKDESEQYAAEITNATRDAYDKAEQEFDTSGNSDIRIRKPQSSS